MEELLKILSEVRPDVDFTSDNLASDGILESMDIIIILDTLSTHYNISFNPLDIIPENFDSAEAINELVQRTIAAK